LSCWWASLSLCCYYWLSVAILHSLSLFLINWMRKNKKKKKKKKSEGYADRFYSHFFHFEEDFDWLLKVFYPWDLIRSFMGTLPFTSLCFILRLVELWALSLNEKYEPQIIGWRKDSSLRISWAH
jgi:hypothetical protein